MRSPLSGSEGFPAAVVKHFFAGNPIKPGETFMGWIPAEVTHESSDGWVVIFQSEANPRFGARVAFRGSFDDLPERLPWEMVTHRQRMVPVPGEFEWR